MVILNIIVVTQILVGALFALGLGDGQFVLLSLKVLGLLIGGLLFAGYMIDRARTRSHRE